MKCGEKGTERDRSGAKRFNKKSRHKVGRYKAGHIP